MEAPTARSRQAPWASRRGAAERWGRPEGPTIRCARRLESEGKMESRHGSSSAVSGAVAVDLARRAVGRAGGEKAVEPRGSCPRR